MPTASKWLDLVIGLDLHFEIVPPSPSPIPFPHPFCERNGLLCRDTVNEHVVDAHG